ncbi:MAG TPA: hypothetical protein VK530_03070 [Candidatus Acidoferrum sp.]|nr:hypothetical protein [Candidatus Acidoferrum sp.]
MNPHGRERLLLSAPAPIANVLVDVVVERARQQQLFDAGKLPFRVCDRATTNSTRLAVAAEEFGEIAHAINEGTVTVQERAHLREEVIQLAAVCVAWAEALNPKQEGPRA